MQPNRAAALVMPESMSVGFNQRNVAVMINGVPQNDMETLGLLVELGWCW